MVGLALSGYWVTVLLVNKPMDIGSGVVTISSFVVCVCVNSVLVAFVGVGLDDGMGGRCEGLLRACRR